MALFGDTLLAFLAFGLCASGGYILNDLLDLDSDRRHPEKRRRAIASGSVSARGALVLAPPMILAGVGVGFLVVPMLAMVLLLYLAATPEEAVAHIVKSVERGARSVIRDA